MVTPFLILTALLFFGLPSMIQEQQPNKPATVSPGPTASLPAPIPAADADRANPVHPTPESLARAGRIYKMDCAMCHGEDGSGKSEITLASKMLDYRDPTSLKELTDGQIFYIIKNGRGEMPPEGERAKPDETWNLVIYVRSFSKQIAVSHGSSQ